MKIAILGSGSFALAMAYQLTINNQNKVTLFARDENQVSEINKKGTNKKYIRSLYFSKQVSASHNYQELANYNIVFICIPSAAIGDDFEILADNIKRDALLVNMAKGLAVNGKTICQFLQDDYQLNNVVSLKGPSFSLELINNSPLSLTLGYQYFEQSEQIDQIIQATDIYLDYTTDLNGVEYLSALKNIYAIYMGHIAAQFHSYNTKYTALNQCFNEIRIVLNYLQCKSDTVHLSCGFGDFCLTALSDLSRNRTLGLMIGKGLYTNDTLEKSPVVFEGLKTLNLLFEKIENKVLNTLPVLRSLVSYFITQEDENLNMDLKSLLNKKVKTVLTYGTFDLLHYGHLEILKRAKDIGDRLIVGLSTDEFNLEKNKVCEFSYEKRKLYLESLSFVDLVIPEEKWRQKENDVQKYGVDYFVMGSDWEGEFNELKQYCKVLYLPRTKGVSTTKLKKILKEE